MLTPQVIYKDKDFLAVNKPAGLIVHNGSESLAVWLVENYPETANVGDDPKVRPGIVHRLDKDTSGVMLVCRSQKAFDYFKRQFQERKIKKTYLALVYGVLKEKSGIIEKPFGIKSGSVKRTAYIKKARMVKEAATKYRVISIFGSPTSDRKSDFLSLLEVQPLTGRTHQIRVHLASIGHPVVGDKLYGPKKQLVDRQFLHAESLEFTALNGQRMKIEAELPDDLKNFLDAIR